MLICLMEKRGANDEDGESPIAQYKNPWYIR